MRTAAVLTAFSLFLIFADFSFAKETEEGAYWLVQRKCTICHDSERIKSARHTPEEWAKTVDRMRLKKPDNISQEEAREIAAYLAATYSKPAGVNSPGDSANVNAAANSTVNSAANSTAAKSAAAKELSESQVGKFIGILALASLSLSFGLGMVMMRGKRYLFRWHRMFGYITMVIALAHGVYIFIFL